MTWIPLRSLWSQLTSTYGTTKYPTKTKKIRDRTKLTGPTLAKNFTPQEFNGDITIDEATSHFNMELLKALNAITPFKSIKFTNQPKHSWFNKFIREQRRVVKNHKEDGKKV